MKWIFCLAWIVTRLVSVIASESYQGSNFTVLEIKPNQVVFALKPFEFNIEQIHLGDNFYHRVLIPDYGVTTRPGWPMLPATGALIPIPAQGEVSVTVIESDFEEIQHISILPAPTLLENSQPERAAYQFKKNLPVYSSDTYWPVQLAEMESRGKLRGQSIGRIQVNPVQYNPVRQTLRIYRSLKIQVTFSQSLVIKGQHPRTESALFEQLTNRLLLMQDGAFAGETQPFDLNLKQQQNDWYNPQYDYTKLYIDEEGIYELTYQDLLNAGVAVDLLDLEHLKIYNQGKQIPLWITGPQTGVFSPDNSVYFYGDWNRGTDTYFDFYTDTNIYWLTADGEIGKRYQSVGENNSPANLSQYDWQTLHLEEDKILHRSNRSSPMDEDEGWIWRYFFDDDRETIKFEVTGLFESVVDCSLKIRIYGTTRDPVDPDHHVRLSINGEMIGETNFDGQQELIWNLPFSTQYLQEEENSVELHLVADTGAQLNQIYLDWIEITYPGVYAASRGELKFKEDTSTGLLTEYPLVNFADEQVSVFAPAQGRMWQPKAQKKSFYRVESAGFDDGKYAKMMVDFETVYFNEVERGHNLVAIDPETSEKEIRHFDTFAYPDSANAMADYIFGLPDSTIVLAAIIDEGSFSMTERAYQALESLGSALARDVQGRDSWALIGYKGAKVGTVKEALSRRFSGPVAVADTLTGKLALRFAATFRDTSSKNNAYFAVSKNAFKKVQSIVQDQKSDLHATTHGADYIIITHEIFKQEAERLARYRTQKSGFRCFVADVQDIYDEFNGGIMHPRAIKDFLTYTYLNWQKPAPTFVLMFGDASWDSKMLSAEAVKQNFVPSYGVLVADNWFVSLDGPDDFLPDMFVGRIPAETPQQAAVVIDKIMAYENLEFDAWNKEFIFLNGGIGAIEQSLFLSQANRLITDHIEAPPFQGKAIKFNKTSDEAITRFFWPDVAAEIREGVQWVNFLGHAGSTVWDVDIRQPEDWQNDEIFPFMTGMSCHSARYANPILNSLGELYFMNSMGASAYWGSSGFGYITQDFFLLDGLFKAVAQDTVRSVGVATTLAKWHLWDILGNQLHSRDVINQYSLLGDPAMNLIIPEKPEFTVYPEDIQFEKNLLLISDSTTQISTRIHNFGLLPQDSLDIHLTVVDEENKNYSFAPGKMKPFGIQDSLTFTWDLPDKPGFYQIEARIDPDDKIEEEDELNNSATTTVFVFSSDLTIIKPFEFAVVTTSSPELVINNSRMPGQNLEYYFEVDTSVSFSSPLLQQSMAIAEGKLVTRWQPQLTVPAVYHWRARTYDGETYGPWVQATFSYSPQNAFKWQQSIPVQFNKNNLNNVESQEKNEASLKLNTFVFKAESAGFFAGSYAYLWRNDDFFYENKRGLNLAVFDETTADFISKSSFDTFVDAANSEAMAEYINDIPNGRIVLAAIHDEGTFSMTENGYLALESIGSALIRQVGYRDSWALIGRKGAAAGTFPEATKKSGDGSVTVLDTVKLYSKNGMMVSTPVGPALDWKSAGFIYEANPTENGIQFNLFGRNKSTGQVDSLFTRLTGVDQVDLSAVDAKKYPQLQFQADYYSKDGQSTSALKSWALDYEQPPDLVIGRKSIHLSADTVVVGEQIDLQLEVGNFGYSPADSFSIRLFTKKPPAGSIELSRLKVEELASDEIKTYRTSFPTSDFTGKVTVHVEVDADNELAELHETNNAFSFPLWVARDTTSPDIRITFDSRVLGEGEFVATHPQVLVEIRDATQTSFTDTGQVSILLDEQKVPYGSGPEQAQLLPQQNPADATLRAVVLFSPVLNEGEHQVEVIAKDRAGNLNYLQTHFYVSSEFVLADVMNYPNPFQNETEFTYTLTQDADEVRLKMYTIAGRLIEELDFLPSAVGFNHFLWDGRDRDGDRLSNGVYLYKIIARRGEQQVEAIEKFVVMR